MYRILQSQNSLACFITVLALVVSQSALAQHELLSLQPSSDEWVLGTAAYGAGDVNKDGVADIIVEERPAEYQEDWPIQSRVISGKDLSTLFVFENERATEVTADLNADGYSDLFLQTETAHLVRSGFDGSILFELDGIVSSITTIEDLDDDNWKEVLVGEGGWGPCEEYLCGEETAIGRVRVISGRTGEVIFLHFGEGRRDHLGFEVASAGDINADGKHDYLVSDQVAPAPSVGDLLNVKLYSGADGSLLREYEGAFLFSKTPIGDYDSDGTDDLGIQFSGATFIVISGKTDEDLLVLPLGRHSARKTYPLEDIDGDGVTDFGMMNLHYFTLYSGEDGAQIFRFGVDEDFVHLGDFNGDGYRDFAATDHGESKPHFSGRNLIPGYSHGQVTIYSLDACPGDLHKQEPGICGCGTPDTDRDADGLPHCIDFCDRDPAKTEPGQCGCGEPDQDNDQDGSLQCEDLCDEDPLKTSPGFCGCGIADIDIDGDGIPVCDGCPADPDKIEPGICGCGVPDTDANGNGLLDCFEDVSSDPPAPTTPADSESAKGLADISQKLTRRVKGKTSGETLAFIQNALSNVAAALTEAIATLETNKKQERALRRLARTLQRASLSTGKKKKLRKRLRKARQAAKKLIKLM